jgi:hypothetical protein
MLDRYTKVVLTIIAVTLVALVAQQAIPTARASADCGDSSYRPCYMHIVNLR